MPPFVFALGERVEVESADDGFEGCWCEAMVTKQLRSKGAIGGDPNMYEVRYTRFVGSRGKPIAETVCEQRVRPEVPGVVGYTAKTGDFVDALWWDGWWHGHVLKVDNAGKQAVAHVKFPTANDQVLRLKISDVRAHLKRDPETGKWLQKMPAGAGAAEAPATSSSKDAAASNHSWTLMEQAQLVPRSPSSKKRRESGHDGGGGGAEGSSGSGPAKHARTRDKLPELPECPTFHPTAEEFADPFEFIASIREQVEPYGVCKVVPPPNWKPSWPINSENFKFNTRIQNVHQLQERGEFIFWKQLKESLERQGNPIKMLPRLDGKQIDMFTLYRRVVRMGGHGKVSAEAKWSEVADELKVSRRLDTRAALVQNLYTQYLQVYEDEQAGQTSETAKSAQSAVLAGNRGARSARPGATGRPSADPATTASPAETKSEDAMMDTGESKRTAVSPEAAMPGYSCVRSAPLESGSASGHTDAAAVSLAGAAVATALPTPPKSAEAHNLKSPDGSTLVAGLVLDDEDQLDQKCEICNTDDDPSSILLCDSCDGGYHTYCLRPKVRNVPKGEWHCPRCRKTAQVLLDEPFGFKDGPRYSLPTFHTLAQSYKARWFNGVEPQVHDIEQDFWEIVEGGSLNHDVQVLYGNDLPTLTYGSGFSTDGCDEYATHPWNLNVMPTLPGSLLRHLEEVKRGQRLSGIVAPWIYFGMLFSSFCWHNEDNYLYSINYMHWGEGKVWYSVPGYAAEQLEEAMRASMPELFASSPDLLFHITTMLSPRVLHEAKVPCYKLVQEAGTYVITFPKAYHAGFSLGFNCGEAVNFAIADWLPWGQDAISKYRSFRHLAAFSLQKLLCSIAEAPLEQLLPDRARSLEQVAAAMAKEVREETAARDAVCKAGVMMHLRLDQAPPVAREDGDEDGRLCAVCKQNCYFSFVSCPCDMARNVCLHHHAQLCECHASRHVLFFRHTVQHLETLRERCFHAAAKAKETAGAASGTGGDCGGGGSGGGGGGGESTEAASVGAEAAASPQSAASQAMS